MSPKTIGLYRVWWPERGDHSALSWWNGSYFGLTHDSGSEKWCKDNSDTQSSCNITRWELAEADSQQVDASAERDAAGIAAAEADAAARAFFNSTTIPASLPSAGLLTIHNPDARRMS